MYDTMIVHCHQSTDGGILEIAGVGGLCFEIVPANPKFAYHKVTRVRHTASASCSHSAPGGYPRQHAGASARGVEGACRMRIPGTQTRQTMGVACRAGEGGRENAARICL